MADETITYEDGADQDRARQQGWQADNLRQRNAGRKSQERLQKSMTAGRSNPRQAAAADSGEQAVGVIRSGWLEWIENGLEGIGQAFWGVLSLPLIGPILAVFFRRFDATIKKDPKYAFTSTANGWMHAGAVGMNLVWAVMWLAVILIVVVVVYAQMQSTCAWAGFIINIFANGTCT